MRYRHSSCFPAGLLSPSGLIDVRLRAWLFCCCFFFPSVSRRPTLIHFFLVYFTAMQLFGLNWQLQELDNQPAFENGGVGKTGPTQTSIVTALAADGEQIRDFCEVRSPAKIWMHDFNPFVFVVLSVGVLTNLLRVKLHFHTHELVQLCVCFYEFCECEIQVCWQN